MSDTRTHWRARFGHGVIRSVFSLLALGLAFAPFAYAAHRHIAKLQVTEQFSTAPTTLTAEQQEHASAVNARLPGRTPPVILAYHDVRPVSATEEYPDPTKNPNYHYVVTPEAFDAQLSTLKAAGYSSITTDQYVDYLGGGEIPERSVMITFDDGTHGLWTHADKILERLGMHGVSFLITANVGEKRPYYLSWEEIAEMADSGRWDFESHTRKMHAKLPINAEGTKGSEIVNRRWLFERNRLETLTEFEEKIRTDLQGSIDDIVAHGLPRPRLFAFPFSEGYRTLEGGDPEANAVAETVINEFFTGSFNNAPPLPLPPGSRAAEAGMAGRIEITLDTTVAELLTQVEARTAVTPTQAPPARRPDLWIPLTEAPVVPHANGGVLSLSGPGLYQEVAYGLDATADWASYRGSVTVTGLTDGRPAAYVMTRVGSGAEAKVRVSADKVRVSVGRRSADVVIDGRDLTPSDRHTVDFTVSPAGTEFVIDGSVRLWAAANGEPSDYGGFGLIATRDSEAFPWPTFTALSVTEGVDYPNVDAGVGIPAG
ncbi:polysaccharide deacetylase family protein [Mycobacterium sp. 236(2023)]|uniref:polysaccharide deacetylase family protein n=1 Tax=Mycobacterium sp. 236(2023) TaxID=3038163 RepID=UPI0024155961|nr:polysaccharide deacetylase family protein [Mycobacterium sp. 236(2023)]MDG4664930.1 polysaccharide deacetylase family protein [Mycobacterium sp. 236(2023)]